MLFPLRKFSKFDVNYKKIKTKIITLLIIMKIGQKNYQFSLKSFYSISSGRILHRLGLRVRLHIGVKLSLALEAIA